MVGALRRPGRSGRVLRHASCAAWPSS